MLSFKQDLILMVLKILHQLACLSALLSALLFCSLLEHSICFVKPTIHLNIALRGITRLPQKKQEPELLYRHLEVPSTGCSGFRTTSTHNSIYLLRLPEETCLSAERILRRFCSRLWGIPLVSPARRLLFSFILFIPSFVLLYFV